MPAANDDALVNASPTGLNRVFTYCNSIEPTDENRWVSRTGQDRYGSCRYEGLTRGKEPRPPKHHPSSRSRQVRGSREARGLGERIRRIRPEGQRRPRTTVVRLVAEQSA